MIDGPLVSVVTPVYNGAEHIAECIESVLAQTYRNWDYAIVDNASTDATPEIVRQYAARDPRVRHLRFEEFVDATANHNRAFDSISAESEFCKVVQADDWLFPECLERMVAAAAGQPNVGIIGAYQLRGVGVDLTGLPYETTVAPGHEILRGSLLGRYNVTGPPTATMLRSSAVRSRRPFWEPGLRHEDEDANFSILIKYDFAYVHQVLTYSRPQEGSRWEWSQWMNSHDAENILFLLRYGRAQPDGPPVLTDEEYRRRLRQRLRQFVWWHTKQVGRVSRLRDPEFFELHRRVREKILREADGDREVVAAMAVIGALLQRDAPTRASFRRR